MLLITNDRRQKLCADSNTMPDSVALCDALYLELLRVVQASETGPLGDEARRTIIQLKLGTRAAAASKLPG